MIPLRFLIVKQIRTLHQYLAKFATTSCAEMFVVSGSALEQYILQPFKLLNIRWRDMLPVRSMNIAREGIGS